MVPRGPQGSAQAGLFPHRLQAPKIPKSLFLSKKLSVLSNDFVSFSKSLVLLGQGLDRKCSPETGKVHKARAGLCWGNPAPWRQTASSHPEMAIVTVKGTVHPFPRSCAAFRQAEGPQGGMDSFPPGLALSPTGRVAQELVGLSRGGFFMEMGETPRCVYCLCWSLVSS